jgi:hypothetical protein
MIKYEMVIVIQSNWAVEGVRAARHSKIMCALVLALRKIPIYGPRGRAPPLSDPSNPAYSVAVSDGVAAKSKEKAAKDADSARLHPLIAYEDKSDKEKQDDEKATADALNAIQFANGERIREEERENDRVNIVRTQDSARENLLNEENEKATMGTRSQKTESGKGRRQPGQSAPGPSLEEIQSRASMVSGQREEGLDVVESRLARVQTSRSGVGSERGKEEFDQEAQIGR